MTQEGAPSGLRGRAAVRDDLAGALMHRWGVEDTDESAYDMACADVDVVVAALRSVAVEDRMELIGMHQWDQVPDRDGVRHPLFIEAAFDA